MIVGSYYNKIKFLSNYHTTKTTKPPQNERLPTTHANDQPNGHEQPTTITTQLRLWTHHLLPASKPSHPIGTEPKSETHV